LRLALAGFLLGSLLFYNEDGCDMFLPNVRLSSAVRNYNLGENDFLNAIFMALVKFHGFSYDMEHRRMRR
jgi:hypothetical protein